MGIIEKQSIKGTIFSYLGVIVGFVTAGILQPEFLGPEQNGVLDLLMTWSLLFATLATLGINNVTNRLFPHFRDPNSHHKGYFSLVFWVTVVGFCLSMALFLIMRPGLIAKSVEKSALFIPYVDYIIPLTAFTAIYLVVDIYYAALYKSVTGIFIREFLMRIFILVTLLLYIIHWIGFPGMILSYVLSLSLPGIIISAFLIRDREFKVKPRFGWIKPDLTRSIVSVAGFGVVMTFSNIVVQYVDRIMIDRILGIGEVGIYGRAFIFGTLVSIASRAVIKISNIVVAQAWKDNNTRDILQIYRQSTILQLLFGSLIFVGIVGNLDNILRIWPEDYASGVYVIVFIGLANLFHMASGVSVTVMSTSRHYRLLAVFILIFVGILIVSNLILIPAMGITGAALASAISVFLYSLMRYLYLKIKYRMEPYSFKHILIILIGIISFAAGFMIPDLYQTEHHYLTLILDISVRSATITLFFVLFTWITQVSPDLNDRIRSYLKR